MQGHVTDSTKQYCLGTRLSEHLQCRLNSWIMFTLRARKVNKSPWRIASNKKCPYTSNNTGHNMSALKFRYLGLFSDECFLFPIVQLSHWVLLLGYSGWSCCAGLCSQYIDTSTDLLLSQSWCVCCSWINVPVHPKRVRKIKLSWRG